MEVHEYEHEVTAIQSLRSNPWGFFSEIEGTNLHITKKFRKFA